MIADKASSVFWLVFGMIVIYLSKRLGLGTLTHFGPGFLPFWSGVILCGLSVVVLVRSRKRGGNGPKKVGHLWNGMHWSKPVIVVVVLLFYILTFSRLGFIISTSVLLFVLLKAIDPVKGWVSIVVSIVTSIISFVLFDLWFQVQLPHWVFESFLFNLKRGLF